MNKYQDKYFELQKEYHALVLDLAAERRISKKEEILTRIKLINEKLDVLKNKMIGEE